MAERFAEIAVEKTTLRFDRPFSYRVPEGLAQAVVPGVRVTVPFGAGDRTRVGLVLSVCGDAAAGTKDVLTVLDEEPLLDGEMLALVPWIASRYYCTLFEAVRLMLPVGIGVKLVERCRLDPDFKDFDREAYPDPEWRIITALFAHRDGMTLRQLGEKLGLAAKDPALESLAARGIVRVERAPVRGVRDATARMAAPVADYGGRLTPKQQAVYDVLCDVGAVTVQELCYFTGVGAGVVKTMAEKGAVDLFDAERFRRPKPPAPGEIRLPETLSAEQQREADAICREIDAGDAAVALLYGVTGAGKTAVFLHAIRHVLEKGRGVIVMVPEIALTAQTLSVFLAAFGDSVAMFHSGLSVGERMDEWKRVRTGRARIVVGTRSAVFAPVRDLGLIVMDEEQEPAYRSESSPRYHAREVARFRAAYNKAYCLLCSATPSVETFYMAQRGKYYYHELSSRYGEAVMPRVELADMNAEDVYRGKPLIGVSLANAISENLREGRQSILLLNRRGYHTYAVCRDCRTVMTCPNCSISMTYHAANGRLMCHYCGHSEPATSKCPNCGGMLSYSGGGTQKAEDQLREAFPEARILRVDTDTTANKYALEKKLASFAAGEYDIMVGTQMVAKGLDFENVTLVGVLSADRTLCGDDYRSGERTFDLLTQVVGRAGRGRYRGTALIQTYLPENDVLRLAAAQDYRTFYETEIRFRRALLYPPFSDILQIGFVAEREEDAKAGAEWFSGTLTETFRREHPELPLRVLRASAATVARVGGKYRYKIIMKYKNTTKFREVIASLLRDFQSDRRFSAVTAYADPNPETIL